MTNNNPYLERIVVEKLYNPEYGDDRICECGHKYYRHFDTYEDMYNCGCKYCGCGNFVELTEQKENEIRALVKHAYHNAMENGYNIHSQYVLDLAYDMADCDADLANYDPRVLIKYINEIRSGI